MKTTDYSEIGWPAPDLRLLLRVYYSPVEQARDAWHKWLSFHSIDSATWAEVRLLAAIAQRIQIIEPGSSQQPLLEGVRRFVWARNQLRLDRSMPVIDILSNANIPVMILKGVARIAGNPAVTAARFVRDIDIMIEAQRLDEACDVLITNGWRPVNGILPGISRAEPFAQLLPECDGRNNIFSEDIHVDIHRSAIHYGRSGTFDDIFWTRCHDAFLRGRRVKIPASTDQFLQAIVHGTIGDVNRPVDWVIDALDAKAATDFNWDIFTEEVRRRRAGAAVKPGLDYLACEFGLEIPENLRNIIRRDQRNLLFRTEVLVYWRMKENKVPHGSKIRRLVEWFRSRHVLYRPAKVRKTLWQADAVSNMHHIDTVTDLVPGSMPVIEFNTILRDRENRLTVDVTLEGAKEPVIYFDLLLDEIWFGRLKLDLEKPYDRKVTASFNDVIIPEILLEYKTNTKLHIVYINSRGRVPVMLPFRLEIGLSVNNRKEILQRTLSFDKACSGLSPVN